MNIIKHKDIIIEALLDYRKWFEDDPDKQLEIDRANRAINLKQVTDSDQNQRSKLFHITSVSRKDIIQVFDGDIEIKNIVKGMKNDEMERLASKLADDYCEQLFWSSLKTIFETVHLNSGKEGYGK